MEWLVLDRQKHTVTQTRDALEDGVRRETKKNHLFTSVFSLKQAVKSPIENECT